jgi:hypothetical protein
MVVYFMPFKAARSSGQVFFEWFYPPPFVLSVHITHSCFLFALLSLARKNWFVLFYPFLGTTKLMSGTKRRYEELQPQLQRDIVKDYRRGVRGHGYIAIAKKHQLPVTTVQSVIARAERAGGDRVAPRGEAGERRAGEVVQ